MKQEVIKHSAAVQITNSITLIQRQTWNLLLAYAYEGLVDKEEHEVSLKSLVDDLQLTTNNVNHLKTALKGLMTTVVEWNVLGRDGEEEWTAMTLLAQVGFKKGVCTYAYAPKLRRLLYNPRMYAKVQLAVQCKFTSKHALAVYEHVCDYRGVGQTPWVTVEDLKRLLDTTGDGYAEFNKWRNRVLDVAVKEVNQRSDLIISPTFEKGEKGRVKRIKFVIEAKAGKPAAAKPVPKDVRADRSGQVEMPFLEIHEAPEIDPEEVLAKMPLEQLDALKKKAEGLVHAEHGALEEFYRDLLVRVRMKSIVLEEHSTRRAAA